MDREEHLRQEVRNVLDDLRHYGIPVCLIRGRTLPELWDLKDQTIRNLMRAPDAA